ncbi:hypothetical protein WJX73_007054 [Symbiochloris irregularis]|uniref:F-box domain-containing protein n=1 Tax=Symbiochloris irregularis TaxID=706552 RepID=A0AAW1NY15_9CHLO
MPTTRRQTRVNRLEIFSPELSEVFAVSMLPHLSLRSLVAVTCTCKALRDTAYLRDDPWRAAATRHLPPQHPSLAGKTREAVQRLLQQRLEARKAVSFARDASTVELLKDCPEASKLQFSADGELIAALLYGVSGPVLASGA